MVYYCVPKIPVFAPVLILINPVYALLLRFFQTHFITLSFMARSYKILFPGIPHTNRKLLNSASVRMCGECTSRLVNGVVYACSLNI
jgi:hypothetical protein